MSELWQPPIPPCITLMKAESALTIRNTPSIAGVNMGKLPAGSIVRVDPGDYCLLYGAKYRYIRLVAWNDYTYPEPVYTVWQEVTDAGVTDWLTPHSDDCDEIPEIPEDDVMDWIDLEITKLNVVLPFLHDKVGNEQLKAKLAPAALVAMQELIVGATTPDVEPPVEEEPEPVPEIPPVEEFPPVEVPETPEPAPPTMPFEARGNRIYKDGNLWNKFIGVTHRGIAWYGVADVLEHSNEGQIAAQLDYDQSLGVQVVRFYCAHHKYDVQFAIPRVKRILDMLQEREMYGVVCLTDGAHSGFHVADSSVNRGVFIKGNERYSKEWIENKKYQEYYLPYATKMVKAISNHPAIFSIQPINELTTIDDNPTLSYMNAVLDFYRKVIGMINRESPNSMTSTGLVSAHEVFGFAADESRNAYTGFKGAEKLYRMVSYASVHSYQDKDAPGEALGSTRDNLVHEFKMAGIPHVWEEMNGLHSDPTTNWMDKALNASAQAVVGWMLWNPCWNIGDNNDCDGLNPAKDGHNGARKHNYSGWVKAWANNLRIAT